MYSGNVKDLGKRILSFFSKWKKDIYWPLQSIFNLSFIEIFLFQFNLGDGMGSGIISILLKK